MESDRTRLVDGEVAFLEWAATSDHALVRDGADSYVIRQGRIITQTIHYTVEPRRGRSRQRPGAARS